MARSIIHDAAFNLDVAALRRGLDAGESPDLLEDEYGSLRLPLQDAIVYGCALPHKSIEKRLAFIEALLEAGASVDVTTNGGRTALHCAVMQLDRRQYPTDFELIVDRLLRAGADVNATFPVNATNEEGTSVLAMAASNGRSTVITKLLSAGAVDPKGFDEPLRRALISHRPRNCAVLMRAGAVLRREIHPEYYAWLKDPYLRKVYETPGGFLCRNQNPPSTHWMISTQVALRPTRRHIGSASRPSSSRGRSSSPSRRRSSRTSSRSVSTAGATKGNRASYTGGQGPTTAH